MGNTKVSLSSSSFFTMSSSKTVESLSSGCGDSVQTYTSKMQKEVCRVGPTKDDSESPWRLHKVHKHGNSLLMQ